MDLDTAIKYYSNLADDCRRKASPERNDYMDLKDLAAERGQLADWLNELKILREKVRTLLEKDKWIPVTERLPEKEGCYLVTIKCDHERIYSKTAWYPGDGWLARKDIIAWRLTPEPYTEEEK